LIEISSQEELKNPCHMSGITEDSQDVTR